MVTGFVLVASQASFIVLAQGYLPNRLGLASGVTLGLAVSLGGAASPLLGAIADVRGVDATLLTVGGLTLLATAIGFTLPREASFPGRAAAAPAATDGAASAAYVEEAVVPSSTLP